MTLSSTSEEDAEDLVTEAVSVLHSNGAETWRTAGRARQLARPLALEAEFRGGWQWSSLEFGPATSAERRWFSAPPLAIAMNRVSAVDDVIDRVAARTIAVADARAAVATAAKLPAANIFLFAAACGVAAAGLAVILGITHPGTALLIAAAAVGGAFLRRLVGSVGGNAYWQVGVAATLAGIVGVLAADLDISSPLRLAAVCPCMVLVPGPHLLNGAIDVASTRIPLGFARLAYAALTLLAIGTGLIIGLGVGGANLSPDPAGHEIPLWLDMVTAGVVAVCYGIFYSAPLRTLIWPLLIGPAVHGLHWVALEDWHLSAAVAAGISCLFAATILIPISRRFRAPFAVIGFASVVSLLPGVVVFRALSGLVQLQTARGIRADALLLATVNNWTTAFITVFLMAIGFVIPIAVYSRIYDRKRTP